MPVTTEIMASAGHIKLILLDVDGVFTDGRLYQSSDGHEMRAFHATDGLGIRMGQRGGLSFGIISGRESAVVRARAEELDIDEVHLGVMDKLSCYLDIIDRLSLDAREVCFVGDDLIDLQVMRRVGFSVAPPNAVSEVKQHADLVTDHSGGLGAIREVIDLILRATGKWDSVTKHYFE